MKDALNRAKSLYKRQNYRLALEILESSLGSIRKLSPPDRIQTLDLLAALCEKQGSLSKAQSYAVKTIKEDGQDLRGYLRLGKILQLSMDKLEQAIRVYERALKKAHFSNADQKAFIDRQIMLCQTRLANSRNHGASGLKSPSVSGDSYAEGNRGTTPPEKRRDILYSLPTEILLDIFGGFNTRELVTACQVCKAWRWFLESQPQLWSSIRITASPVVLAAHQTSSSAGAPLSISRLGKKEVPVIHHSTVVKYINLSRHLLQLDLQQVLVKSPELLVRALGLGNVNDRLQALLFDNTVAMNGPPTVRMLRELKVPFGQLRSLRITTDMPARDLAWCVTVLPSLEDLDLITTQQIYPCSRRGLINLKVASTNLSSLSILGQSGSVSIPEIMLEDVISQLPHLRSVDLHRVASRYWPALYGLFANPHLVRFGFTGEGDTEMLMPLPNFVSGGLTSLALNNTRVSREILALTVPSGEPFRGGGAGVQNKLEYLEFKRTELVDTTLCELINDWGCTESLQTLVIHSLRQPTGWADRQMTRLHTLQYTNMNTLDNGALTWIIKNCPVLRKLNLDGTSVSGPQIVQLLTSVPSIVAVRCGNIAEISVDTVKWLTSLPGRNVIFGAA